MTKLLTNASTYDWNTWFMGIMRAAIGGGSGAVAGLVITVGTGLKHQLVSAVEAFVIVAITHIFIFLQTHQGPDKVVPPPVVPPIGVTQ